MSVLSFSIPEKIVEQRAMVNEKLKSIQCVKNCNVTIQVVLKGFIYHRHFVSTKKTFINGTGPDKFVQLLRKKRSATVLKGLSMLNIIFSIQCDSHHQ